MLIIYGDDVGFADVSAYKRFGGDGKIPTPAIDRLAAHGILFTDAHASSATCTPSRYSMLTGTWSFRRRIGILPPDAPLCIPPGSLTLPALFKKAGYRTAVVGKWHLGIGRKGVPNDWNGELRNTPNDVGFDYSFLLPYTNDRVPCVYLRNRRVVNLDPADPLFVGPAPPPGFHGTVYPDGKKHPEAMTYMKSTHGHNDSVINGIGRIGYMWGGKSALWDDAAMSRTFLEEAKRYISSSRGRPFFLYFAPQCIHVPRVPAPRFRGKSGLGARGDSMLEFDWLTGELLAFLKKNGLLENTIVIFTSDNGPVYDDGYADGSHVRGSSAEVDNGHDASGPWRGGKYQIFEGGTRVPLIIYWKGHIRPGQVSHALVSQVDFLASFARLLRIPLAPDEAPDSRDMLDVFLGKSAADRPYAVEEAFGTLAIRRGKWKYIPPLRRKNRETPARLFDLDRDLGERHNVIAEHPEIADEMQKLLDREIARKTRE